MSSQDAPKAQSLAITPFWVNDRPHCVWGDEIIQENRSFLNNIDADYFVFGLDFYSERLLEQENRNRAALAIRNRYFHAIESLFTLVCAMVQAPEAVVAWINLSRIQDVREIVGAISESKFDKYILPIEALNWRSLIEFVFHSTIMNGSREAYCDFFSDFLTHLAEEFLSPNNTGEYNAIKHGVRAHQSGFAIKAESVKGSELSGSIGSEILTAGSEFGTSFCIADSLDRSQKRSRPMHVALTHRSNGWDPVATKNTIEIVSMCIHNFKAILLAINKVQGNHELLTPLLENLDGREYRKKPALTALSFSLNYKIPSEQLPDENDLNKRILKIRQNVLAQAPLHPPD